jgi:hypothetical protein
MIGLLQDRRIAPFLIALAVAGLLLSIFLHGNFCLVPSTNIKVGELATAEVSIYGIALYRQSGVESEAMYQQAVWLYEMSILCEWLVAVAVGAIVYLVLRLTQRRTSEA